MAKPMRWILAGGITDFLSFGGVLYFTLPGMRDLMDGVLAELDSLAHLALVLLLVQGTQMIHWFSP